MTRLSSFTKRDGVARMFHCLPSTIRPCLSRIQPRCEHHTHHAPPTKGKSEQHPSLVSRFPEPDHDAAPINAHTAVPSSLDPSGRATTYHHPPSACLSQPHRHSWLASGVRSIQAACSQFRCDDRIHGGVRYCAALVPRQVDRTFRARSRVFVDGC